MPRAKRGVKGRRRHNKVLKAAKGFVGARRRLYRPAVATVERAWRYAFRDRKARKRDFRSLWIVRINAAAHLCGVNYGRLMGWMKSKDVNLDRKMLADLAVRDFPAFEKLVESVRPSE